jgi:hypothetical protein
MMAVPERHRTLAEVCELYFPGVTPCALRWMIKRRGYPHSRWGREYRLTDSQITAIQRDLSRPARQDPPPPGKRRATVPAKPPGGPVQGGDGAAPAPRRRKPARQYEDARRILAERLASPAAIMPASVPLFPSPGQASPQGT